MDKGEINMATLRANGNELLRIEKIIDNPTSALTVWERETVSYRTNGVVLRKYDVRFEPDRYNPEGRFHSFGWKRWKRAKKDANGGILGIAQRTADKIRNNPNTRWKIVTDNTTTPYRVF
jgi:hypothetical protein